MHRDIRPENIFLTSQGNLKLGSFRSSKVFVNLFSYLRLMEILQKQHYVLNIIWLHNVFKITVMMKKWIFGHLGL